MGQTNATQPKTRGRTLTFVPTPDKLQIIEERAYWIDDDPQIGFCGTLCGTNRRALLFDKRWKRYMIEQLEVLESREWARVLIKYLKRNHDETRDMAYQSEIYWADLDYESKYLPPLEIVENVKLGNFNTTLLAQAGSFMSEENEPNKSIFDRNNVEGVLNSIVEGSEILDEKFYSAHSRETWMTKNYNINLNKKFRKESHFKPLIRAGGLPKAGPSHLSVNKIHSGAVNKSKSIEMYKNNTFVSHLQIANGLDLIKAQTEPGELLQIIAKYKFITNIIEKHMKSENNIFNQIIYLHERNFCTKGNLYIDQYHQNRLTSLQVKDHAEEIIGDLQQMIRILYEAMNLYYKLDRLRIGSLPDDSLFNRDNIINFLTSFLFNERLYGVLFELIRISETSSEQIYQQNIEKFKSIEPQDFGVPNEYCLNEKTINYLQNKGLLHQKVTYNPDNYKVVLETVEEDPMIEESGIYISGKPYDSAIKCLKTLSSRRSPIHKLKTVVKTAELITTSIEDFYRELSQTNTKKLDGDQTLSIFMFIVAKSKITNIAAHCKIIEKFSTNNILNSVSGYYATTLEACLACISSMNYTDNNAKELTQSIKDLIFSMDDSDDVEEGTTKVEPSVTLQSVDMRY